MKQRNPYVRSPSDRTTSPRGLWPRYANAIIGAWLFISAFAWPHAETSRNNTWMIGLIAVVASLWALTTPSVRYVNTVASIWLFITAISYPHLYEITAWNNAIAALAMFGLSLVPSRRLERPRHA